MGFTQNEGGSINYFKIKGMEKASESHFFEVNKERIESNIFRGTLIGAENSSYEYEGQTKPTMKMLFIDDEGEKYQLDASFTMLSRGLINSLIGFIETQADDKPALECKMSLYINKAGYKSLYFLINKGTANWKYSIEKQKTMIEVITNKAGDYISRDTSEFDTALQSDIELIDTYVKSIGFSVEAKKPTEVKVEVPAPEEAKKTKPKVSKDLKEEDLPW